MSSHRSSNPFLESSQHGPSRRASISTTSSRRYQDSSTRSSGHQSSYEDLTKASKQISVAHKRLKEQEMRAADAEQQVLALVDKLKLVNQERIAAIQQASKANEELTLYKIQLQTAHQEIRRGQEIIDKVEHDRYEAEKAAAEARRMARTYQRDLMIMRAMDEGRKLGMQEGIEQGRALALREFDMTDDDLAAEYMEYNEEPLQRSNLLASNEDLLNHLPKQSDVEPLVQPPPLESGEPIPVPPPDLVQRTPLPIPDLVQPTPLPIPDLIQVTPVMRPRSFRSPSPSILHQPISIPPDGYVPTLDSDNVIRIPPPHELSRPPPTPERGPSPQLPEIIQEEPRPSSRSHRRRMSNSSMTSGSTFSNAAGHMGRPPSALSAIPEAQSPYSSPVPEMGLHLRHQASHASNFSNIVDPESIGELRDAPGQSASRRSSMAGSTRPGSVQEDRRKSKSTISSVPGITVVPPEKEKKRKV
ncbi:hypothetical protein H0H93_016161 [Arthromyces matolae]|nr:hypothetical protein H0H93_016161 [Arthromyces matolae]